MTQDQHLMMTALIDTILDQHETIGHRSHAMQLMFDTGIDPHELMETIIAAREHHKVLGNGEDREPPEC